MSSYQTEVKNLNYNAANRTFEALVVFHEGTESRSVPMSAPLPITTEFAQVSAVLVARAKAKRAKGALRLTSRSPARKEGRLIPLDNLIRQFKDAMGLSEMPNAA